MNKFIHSAEGIISSFAGQPKAALSAAHSGATSVAALTLDDAAEADPTPPAAEAKAVRLLWCDSSGLRRCRVVQGRRYADALSYGIGITAACMAMPAHADVPAEGAGLSAVGEVRMVPIEASRVAAPWCPGHQLAVVEFNAPRTVSPWDCCPRRALRNAARMLLDNFGLTLKVGFEIEFVLLQPAAAGEGLYGSSWRPVDRSLYCQSSALDGQAAVLDCMVEALEAMGIEVVQWHAESAPGQFEVALGFCECVQAADRLLLAKEALSGVARSHGLAVSFLPKLQRTAAGSGCHAHLSLWKDGKSHMHVQGGDSLSAAAAGIIAASSMREPAAANLPGPHPPGPPAPPGPPPPAPGPATPTARAEEGTGHRAAPAPALCPSREMVSFLGGLLTYLDCLLLFTTPCPNSFERLRPGTWAGAHAAWGYNNREVPLRVTDPGPQRLHLMNIEFKPLDGAANPHLALAAIAVAGMLGIFQQAAPPEPCQVPPQSLEPEAAARLGVRPLPASLAEALDKFRTSPAGDAFRLAMVEAIGEPLLQAHLAVRQAEADRAPTDLLRDMLLRY